MWRGVDWWVNGEGADVGKGVEWWGGYLGEEVLRTARIQYFENHSVVTSIQLFAEILEKHVAEKKRNFKGPALKIALSKNSN